MEELSPRDELLMKIAKRIKSLRQQQGVKSQELAAAMRKRGHLWSPPTVTQVEKGPASSNHFRHLHLWEIGDLAECLGVEPWDILSAIFEYPTEDQQFRIGYLMALDQAKHAIDKLTDN